MSDKNNHTIQSWAIERVKPYPRNTKLHDPAQVNKIAKSIKEFGFDQPIVVDAEGVIIKGHGRRLAAIQLGMKYVPVVVRADMSAEQVRASRLADNRVAKGDDDIELLQEELMKLSNSSFDMSSLGFDDRELEFLTATDLDDMNMSEIIDDLAAATNEQIERTETKEKEVKGSKVTVGDALGFKHVSPDQSRILLQFMAIVESNFELKGADALVEFAKSIVEEM